MTTKFDSEGFDLGAVPADGDADANESSIVYELGGGITTQVPESPTKKQATEQHQSQSSSSSTPITTTTTVCSRTPIDESERYKELGNNEFKQNNHLDAYDYYTDAIEKCPYGEHYGPTGDELLSMRDEYDELNRERLMEQQRKAMEKRRAARTTGGGGGSSEDKKEEEDEDDKEQPVEPFTPPRHVYGTKLAVYYANRAATLLHLERNGEVITDCDIAILYNPTYVKAYLRRATAYERIENTEDALKDAQKAYELDPTNTIAKKAVSRLTKLENERMEKLKEETMGKLKDLGNSLLSNFGLSLDNFNAVQDPNTGGYSISFNQGGGGSGGDKK